MRWLFRGLAVLVLAAAAFAGLVALQPAEFRIVRTARIAAAPSAVFAQVNDFHNWQAWSPWLALDPAAKTTFEGPAAGTGAGFGWSGNDKVGEGHMLVTDSKPSDLVRIKLDFVKPMAGTAMTDITFKPVGSETEVTWAMYGQNGFLGKAMCFFVNTDKMVGGDFERGLANLKSVAEKG